MQLADVAQDLRRAALRVAADAQGGSPLGWQPGKLKGVVGCWSGAAGSCQWLERGGDGDREGYS